MSMPTSVLIVTLLVTLPQLLWAEIDANTAIAQGQSLYRQGKYIEAVTAFEQAVATFPNQPELHLWLCRSYGHGAEQASWVTAVKLARKLHQCLERTVAMAPDNKEALSMLSEYYTKAPAFLGGSKDKAAQVQQRLEQLEHSDTNERP